jgi:hypothetical protein
MFKFAFLFFLSLSLLGIALWRFTHVIKNKQWKVWLDDVIISVLANLVFIGIGYLYRQEIYNYFRGPSLVFQGHCNQSSAPGRNHYSCSVVIKNNGKQSLENQRFILITSIPNPKVNFADCRPAKFIPEENVKNFITDTKSPDSTTCQYRISLKGHERAQFTVIVNGDGPAPDLEILQ